MPASRSDDHIHPSQHEQPLQHTLVKHEQQIYQNQQTLNPHNLFPNHPLCQKLSSGHGNEAIHNRSVKLLQHQQQVTQLWEFENQYENATIGETFFKKIVLRDSVLLQTYMFMQ